MRLHIRIFTLSKPFAFAYFLGMTHLALSADLAPASPAAPAKAERPAAFRGELALEKFDQGQVYFQTGTGVAPPAPVRLGAHSVKPLGTLYTRPGMEPYLLLSALPCEGCENRRSLYLVSPSPEFKPTAFVHPGKVRDRARGIVFYEGRSFFGQCLPGRNDVYIAFQHERSEKRARNYISVYIAEVREGRISEQLLAKHAPRLDQVIKRVRAKECTEVAGFDRQTGIFTVPSLKGGELQEED